MMSEEALENPLNLKLADQCRNLQVEIQALRADHQRLKEKCEKMRDILRGFKIDVE